ncbi:MAG: hypothetical protein RLZZ382_1137, partial [Bacteroidota bacterium]
TIFTKSSSTIPLTPPEDLFLDRVQLHDSLAKIPSIHWGKAVNKNIKASVVFKSIAQPAFNKNFDLLRKDLTQYVTEGPSFFF